MLKLTKRGGRWSIETAAAVFEWDMGRGGQLIGCTLKGRTASHALFKGRPAPNLTLDADGRKLSLADTPVEASVVREDAECIAFTTRGRLGGTLVAEQRFDVFREGVLFCEFMIAAEGAQALNIRGAEMTVALDVADAPRMRATYVSRDPYPKQDVTCVHVLSEAKISLDRHERIDRDHLLPIVGLDLGWEESRYYSNRVELIIEDSTSIGCGLLGPTRTVAGPAKGRWELTWTLGQTAEELKAPFFYRNRWGLLCGSGRREAGPGADRALANNVMGARICHVMYPYVRGGQDWPWSSVPVRQTFYQDAQIAAGNPELERVDEAAALGVDTLILHQFWMTNGGSNGEPMADYRPFDPAWLKRFIDRAHGHGMRVGLYMRGIERYSLYFDYFEQYLERDRDGLYVDWAIPFSMGYCKTSALHFSAYDYFMFTRALRRRVGDQGFMIAHSSVQTYASMAAFDAVVVGEFSVMHGGLLSSPAVSTSYAMLGGCGVNLIAGNSADRAVFSSQRAAGFAAGLSYSAHPFMEPNKPFAQVSDYLHPLWALWRALGAPPVRLFNPATGDSPIARWSHEALHPVAYQAASGATLVTLANVSDEPVSGTVDLDFEALGIAAGAAVRPLVVKDTHPIRVEGARLAVENMPAYFYGGVLIA